MINSYNLLAQELRNALYDSKNKYYNEVRGIPKSYDSGLNLVYKLWAMEQFPKYAEKLNAALANIDKALKDARNSFNQNYAAFIEFEKEKHLQETEKLKIALQKMLDDSAADSIAITRKEYDDMVFKLKQDYEIEMDKFKKNIQELDTKYQTVVMNTKAKEELIEQAKAKRVEMLKEQQRLLNECNNQIEQIKLEKNKAAAKLKEIESKSTVEKSNVGAAMAIGAGIVGYFLMNK